MNDKTNQKSKKTIKPYNGANKLLSHVLKEFAVGIKPLIVNYFKSLDELILQIANHSKSKQKQQLYTESLKSIRVHNLNVASSFFNSLKKTFNLFIKYDFGYFEDKITQVSKNEKSVSSSFDKNDITEKLAQNDIIHEYERHYIDELTIFEKRFSFLLSTKVGAYQLPLSPYVLVLAFAKSIRLLHLDINLKLVLYKHFEQVVMTQLGDLYKDINRYLNNNGIVPGLENKIIIVPKKLKGTAPEKTKQRTVQIDADSLLNILTNFQKTLKQEITEKESIVLTPMELQKAILIEIKQVNKGKNITLSQTDKDTMYLTSLMFQLLVDNENIPIEIKLKVAGLQIPYIMSAITDNSLIKNKQHPAQQLLNLISSSSVGWSKKSDTNKTFFNKVNKLIEAIINKHLLEESFFAQLLKDFQAFLKHMKNSFAAEQKRVQEKSKGKEKIVSSMRTVEALLNHKMDNKDLPLEIKTILLGPWKSLLMLLLVRDSNTSEQYLLMVNFIDELLTLLESKQYDIVIKANIDKLCEDYETGLKLVAYNGQELENKVEKFKLCLLKIHHIDGYEPDKPAKQFSPNEVETKTHNKISNANLAKVQTKKANDPIDTSILTELNAKDRALIEPIETGMWFEFIHKNGKAIRAQLSWVSPKHSKYIFVNENGLKITDKTPQELADDLNSDLVTFIGLVDD